MTCIFHPCLLNIHFSSTSFSPCDCGKAECITALEAGTWNESGQSEHCLCGSAMVALTQLPFPAPFSLTHFNYRVWRNNMFFLASLKGRSHFVTQLWPIGCRKKSARSLWENFSFLIKEQLILVLSLLFLLSWTGMWFFWSCSSHFTTMRQRLRAFSRCHLMAEPLNKQWQLPTSRLPDTQEK